MYNDIKTCNIESYICCMKTNLLSAWTAALFFSAAPVQADSLSGKVSGVKSNAVIVYRIDVAAGKAMKPDTLELKDGTFSMNLPQVLQNVYVLAKPEDASVPMPMINPSDAFVYLPGDKLKLNGPIDRLVPSGTRLYDELAALPQRDSLASLKQQTDTLLATVSGYYKDREKNKEIIDRKMKKLKGLYALQADLSKEVVISNPNSLAAAYLISRLSIKNQMEQMKLLSTEKRNGVFKPVFDRTEDYYEQQKMREEARKKMQPGSEAPDFSLPDLTGKQRTLADFRGKYVLLDFWGTWCGWCIKGIPKMKEYYNKYKDRMEIVGICCNDTEEKWRNGIEKHALPWTNLYNGFAKDVVINYDISGFPTKVLIDAEGKLVEVFVGESEEMYQKLDKMFAE